ncbi:MAG: lysoplasmalogenase [Acidimicrobiales bacterium]
MTGAAFLLLALALVVAAGDWVAVGREQKALEYVCKPLTMVVLIAAALALDVDDPAVRTWFVVALVLCLIGDVFLMLPQDLFVFGLASFLLGHVAYIVGMHVDGVDAARLGIGAVLVLVAMAVIGARILRGVRSGPEPELTGPVVAYMTVISAMVASAIGTGHVAGVAGATSFYASDALIAWNRFLGETRHGRLAIIVTYHLAQVGLVLSIT